MKYIFDSRFNFVEVIGLIAALKLFNAGTVVGAVCVIALTLVVSGFGKRECEE